MNKSRITGLFMVLIGAGLYLFYDSDSIDFIIGFLVGGGLALLITGSFGTKKKW